MFEQLEILIRVNRSQIVRKKQQFFVKNDDKKLGNSNGFGTYQKYQCFCKNRLHSSSLSWFFVVLTTTIIIISTPFLLIIHYFSLFSIFNNFFVLVQMNGSLDQKFGFTNHFLLAKTLGWILGRDVLFGPRIWSKFCFLVQNFGSFGQIFWSNVLATDFCQKFWPKPFLLDHRKLHGPCTKSKNFSSCWKCNNYEKFVFASKLKKKTKKFQNLKHIFFTW